jgi:hypothetical protein
VKLEVGQETTTVQVGTNAVAVNTEQSTGNGKTLTPAGQALVNADLFTQPQLASLGAVIQPVQAPPASNPYEHPCGC